MKLLKMLCFLIVADSLCASDIVDQFPDYSVCGYRGGGVKLPNVPVKIQLSPSQLDDTASIQEALDAVGKLPHDENGIRGAVMLTKGTYHVSGTLNILNSGVSLCGQGQKKDGTVIIATGKSKRSLIMLGKGVAEQKQIVLDDTKIGILDKSFSINTTVLQVTDSSGLNVGDGIVVFLEPTESWVKDLGMDKLNKPWKAEDFIRQYERRITSVREGAIQLNVAIPENYNQQHYLPAYIRKINDDKRVMECGVENLRLVSEYQEGEVDSDEEHAWSAVEVGNAINCWVRNITALHFGYSGVALTSVSTNITVQDSACLEPVSRIVGARRYSFLCRGQQCLIQRCFARRGRHSFVTNWKTNGPNVFLDCIAVQALNDSGPHSCWITGTLYDNIQSKDGNLNVQDRGSMGGCHGWAGANEVLWNCEAGGIILEKPPTAQNYAIGCIGLKKTGHTQMRQSGYWESYGVPVTPRSLYLMQLEKRLGCAGIDAVTTFEQRKSFPLKFMEENLFEPDCVVDSAK